MSQKGLDLASFRLFVEKKLGRHGLGKGKRNNGSFGRFNSFRHEQVEKLGNVVQPMNYCCIVRSLISK